MHISEMSVQKTGRDYVYRTPNKYASAILEQCQKVTCICVIFYVQNF